MNSHSVRRQLSVRLQLASESVVRRGISARLDSKEEDHKDLDSNSNPWRPKGMDEKSRRMRRLHFESCSSLSKISIPSISLTIKWRLVKIRQRTEFVRSANFFAKKGVTSDSSISKFAESESFRKLMRIAR